jgi:hypothetical protein
MLFKDIYYNDKMECKYCKKKFSTAGNLKTHQEKTRKCLKIQNKQAEITYNCRYCNKEFVLKDSFDTHSLRHINSPVQLELESLRREVDVLKHELALQTQMNQKTTLALEENIARLTKENVKNREELKDAHDKERETLTKLIFLRMQTEETCDDNVEEEQKPVNTVQLLKTVQADPKIVIDQNNLLQIASEMISAGEVNTTLEFVSSFMFALDSEEKFPINIELLVERKVFDTKGHAKRALLKYFAKDTDYIILNQNNQPLKFVSETETGKQDEDKVEIFPFLDRKGKNEQDHQGNISLKTETGKQDEYKVEIFPFLDRKGKNEQDHQGNISLKTETGKQDEYKVKVFASQPRIAKNKDSRGGGNKETIMLTTECFKSLSQTAMNEVGRQTRLYYQDMEKILKKYILVEYNNRINYQNSELRRISKNHNAILKKRTYFQFKTGPCMYLLSFTGKHKFGFSDDMNKVLPSERRMAPTLRVEFLVYSPDAYKLEQNMLLKYTKNLETPNHEIVLGLDTKTLIDSTRRVICVLDLEHQEEDKVSEYNDQI